MTRRHVDDLGDHPPALPYDGISEDVRRLLAASRNSVRLYEWQSKHAAQSRFMQSHRRNHSMTESAK